jgi:hypothetical protein
MITGSADWEIAHRGGILNLFALLAEFGRWPATKPIMVQEVAMRTNGLIVSFFIALVLGACASNEPTSIPIAANVAAVAPAATGSNAGSDPASDPASDPVIIYVQPPPQSAPDVECREEARTGSHLSRQRCMSRREREEIRDQAQEWMRSGGINGATMTIQ